jgi:hypothetical protein
VPAHLAIGVFWSIGRCHAKHEILRSPMERSRCQSRAVVAAARWSLLTWRRYTYMDCSYTGSRLNSRMAVAERARGWPGTGSNAMRYTGQCYYTSSEMSSQGTGAVVTGPKCVSEETKASSIKLEHKPLVLARCHLWLQLGAYRKSCRPLCLFLSVCKIVNTLQGPNRCRNAPHFEVDRRVTKCRVLGVGGPSSESRALLVPRPLRWRPCPLHVPSDWGTSRS